MKEPLMSQSVPLPLPFSLDRIENRLRAKSKSDARRRPTLLDSISNCVTIPNLCRARARERVVIVVAMQRKMPKVKRIKAMAFNYTAIALAAASKQRQQLDEERLFTH